jgi:hypothetical protein
LQNDDLPSSSKKGSMLNIISFLLNFVWKGIKYFLGFLSILFLGILGAVLFAIPWLLRTASVLIWLVAGYLAISSIDDFYQRYVSSPIPVLALQFASILLMVAWAMVGMMQKGTDAVWGFLATGGIVVGAIFLKLVPWMFFRWPSYANLFFRVLPSALFIVLLIFSTIRLKWLYTTAGTKLSGPAFRWFNPLDEHSVTTDELARNIFESMEGGDIPII